jgi:acyl carrier protein
MSFQLSWNEANTKKAYLQRGVSIPQQLIGSMARDAKRRDKEVLMELSFSVGRDVQNTK